MSESEDILRVTNLTVRYPKREDGLRNRFKVLFPKKRKCETDGGGLQASAEKTADIRKYGKKEVVHQVSFAIKKGEILGLLGESGCGKSTVARAICFLAKDTDGEIVRNTEKIRMIFQDSYDSLNPYMRIGSILEEPLMIAGVKSREERKKRILAILKETELPETLLSHYPAELSGGQRQRVSIACCLLNDPELLIADEPVSALDVTVAVQILTLLEKLNKTRNLSILFISHDIRAVYRISDRVMIMRYGKMIEIGETLQIYQNPQKEYTRELVKGNTYAEAILPG